MFKRKTTITRSDRDRLIEVTRAKANTLRWALFIDKLQRELERARVVEPAPVSPDVVTMNSTVQFLDLQTDRCEVYTLVYPSEADLSVAKLSVLSSLGTALLGARVGERKFSRIGFARVVGHAGHVEVGICPALEVTTRTLSRGVVA